MPDVDDDWLSVQEAADALGLHYRTVWRMVREGELSSTREDSTQGRPYRVRRADVDAFIERSKVKPGELAHLRPPTRRREDAT